MTMDTAPMMNANAMNSMRLDDSPHMTVNCNSIGSKPGSLKHLMLDVNDVNTDNKNRRPMSTTNLRLQPLDDKHRVRNSIASSTSATSNRNSSKHMRQQSAPSVTPSLSTSPSSSSVSSKQLTVRDSMHDSLRGSIINSREPAPRIRNSFLNKYANTTQDKENREEPIYLDELSQLLLEEMHHEDPRMILRALERLSVFCSQSSDLCSQACQMGAPASIVNTMKKWTSQKNIQAKCFRALIAMTVGDDAAQVRKTMWMVGGMEQILKTMAQFPDSRSVQFFGCNAILSLLPSGSFEGLEDNDTKIKKWMGRRFVRECKGVKTVISAMIQFEEDRGLQEAGCSVLLKLATFMHSGQDRKLLLESGAVSAFSVALESHSSDELIQHYTTLFMNFMSGDV